MNVSTSENWRKSSFMVNLTVWFIIRLTKMQQVSSISRFFFHLSCRKQLIGVADYLCYAPVSGFAVT